jgi:thiamine phosphate synthase YjbQ (UPF0047 family)
VETLTFESERRTQPLDVTAEVRRTVQGQYGAAVLLFVPHTTAGLLIQASGEGARRVAADIELAMEELVHETGPTRTSTKVTETLDARSCCPNDCHAGDSS